MENFTFKGPLGNIECIVEKNRSDNNAVLIMSHGFRGSRESGGYAKGVAEKAAAYADVVRYNFSGVNKLSVQIQEIEAVVQEVRRRKENSRIFLLGRSMGGATSLLYASEDKQIAGIVLWSAPFDLDEVFVQVMDEESYAKLAAGETLHLDDERGVCDITPDFLTDYAMLGLPKKFEEWDKRPVLLLHCEADDQVPVHQARHNVKLLGACCESHIFAGGSHSIGEYSEEAGFMVADWLKRNI